MTFKSVIIIPCYNEYARFASENFIDYLKLHPQHAFCFVNDGSTDKTLTLLTTITKECKNASLLSLEKNSGKAMAIYAGIKYSCINIDAKFYGYLDADLATPLSFINIMENEMKTCSQLLMVFGSRQLAEKNTIERKFVRHYIGRVVACLITWALGEKYGDTQCGAKLFTKKGIEIAFVKPFNVTWVFDVELIKRLLLHFEKKDVKNKIKEIPVNQWKDVGNSKVSVFYFFKMLIELLKIKKTRHV